MRIDRPSGGGSDRPDDPDPPDQRRPDEPAEPRRDDPWRPRTDAEVQAAYDEQAAAVREDRAKNPRRLLGSPSVAEDHSDRTDGQSKDRAEAKAGERDALAHDQLDRLPVRQPGDATRGLWTDRDGTEHELISGRDEYTPKVDEVAEEKKIGPDPHRLGVAKHVETKFAVLMREQGLKDESITVNNRPCPGELGCDETLPLFLPAGSSLTVYAPENFKKTYRSTETDQEGTRS